MKQTLLLITVLFSLVTYGQTYSEVLANKDTAIYTYTASTPATYTPGTPSSFTRTVRSYKPPVKDTVVTPPPVDPGTNGTLIYQNDFENLNDLDPFGHGQFSKGSLSADRAFSGAKSFKAVVGGNTSAGYRSEVQFNDPQSPSDADMVYEWHLFLVSVPGSQGLMGQFHANKPDGTSSQGGYFNAGSNSTAAKFELVRNVSGASIRDGGAPFTIPYNKWVTFRIEVKFTTNNTGYWKTYIDGKLVSNVVNTITANGTGQFFKLGFNWFSDPGSALSAYFDGLKIWKK